MRRLILLLAASSLAPVPALAQHAGHNMPGMTMPMPAKPAPKKPAARKPAAKKPAAKKASAKKSAKRSASEKPRSVKKKAVKNLPAEKGAQAQADHGKAASTPAQAQPEDPHAGHDMSQMPGTFSPAQTVDSHAGHQIPAQPTDEHAGHVIGQAAAEVPIGPPPQAALEGPENAADTAWGAAAMEPGRAVLFAEHGDVPAYKVLIDQSEVRMRRGRNGYFLNAEAWYGGDIDKIWFKTETEGPMGSKPEQAEFQALWSHAIDPWFDLQAGVRLDAQPDTRGHLVLGVQGLAPYWIEIDAAAFLSDKGDLTARFEAEHDARITQKLILQPRVELDFALQDISRENVGAGLSRAELGLRLRYQFVPNFAPYVGVAYEQGFGRTREFLRAEGEDPSSVSFAIGLRAWF